ncbi:MAG: hypothetical protein LBT51_04560 [Fusobacteriaceae bacterium]|jgi:CRISPR type III-A/MTUBE-associated protein Csm6|nr:hypothetical protein [Fusobacteriaceae bacterium]
MKKILFSPVGTTDPIANCYDGPLLHICRFYKPDIVYLFLSKEISEFNKKDNRYVYCLEKLMEKTNHSFNIKLIQRNELINVHEFNYFYEEFSTLLHNIKNENLDSQILLNVSSGTPAMQSALYSLAVLGEFKLVAIQVATPENKHNPRRDKIEDYDAELYWETNLDNLENSVNRCKELVEHAALAKFTEKIIIKYIDSYDYVAANVAAESIRDFLDKNVLSLLKISRKRIQLDTSDVEKLTKSLNYDILPVKSNDKIKIFEYLLWMQMKFKRKDYSDFIKGLTPIFFEILKYFIKTKCQLRIDDYLDSEFKWNKSKLTQNKILYDSLNREFGNNFKFGLVYATHFVKIIKNDLYNKDFNFKDLAIEFEKIIEKIRNPVAHNILPVTEDWIKSKSGYTMDEIWSKLKKLSIAAGLPSDNNCWNSYDTINEKIKSLLQI